MTDTPALRHAPGKGSHIALDERRDIQQAHLEGLNRSELALKFGRTRKAIARALDGKDFVELEAKATEGMVETARRRLALAIPKAVDAWVNKAIEKAAGRGNHKPAKDLLLATGVVQADAAPATVVKVAFVGMRGRPIEGPSKADFAAAEAAELDAADGEVVEETSAGARKA